MKYICPICGYNGLVDPPYDDMGYGSWEICSCCGFEFGVEAESPNDKQFFEAMRQKWIEAGAKWKYPEDRPIGWSLNQQLKNIGEDNT